MKPLDDLLNDLEKAMEWSESINTTVSQRAVSWHIAHSLKVISQVIVAVQNSNPEEYQWQFNWVRSLVYTLNFFPRGKGKAPKSVLPAENISAAMLSEEFKTVRQLIPELENLDAKSHFKHPYFGALNLHQTKKFLVLHTKHHLKIIDDIIKFSK